MLNQCGEGRLYALSFQQDPLPTLRFFVWKPCFPLLIDFLNRRTEALIKSWGFDGFIGGAEEARFGFNGAFFAERAENEYFVFSAPLSRERADQAAVSVTLGLSFLGFYVLSAQEKRGETVPRDPNRLQLANLEAGLISGDSLCGGFVSGHVSPTFADWVEKAFQEGRDVSGLIEGMRLAWNVMTGMDWRIPKREGPRSFGARIGEKGSFFISCPGSACDIHTSEWWNREAGEGHDIVCHNIDTPIQVLALLCGFAMLHDLATSEIDPRPPL